MPSLIIFDCDGVLIDSLDFLSGVFINLFKKYRDEIITKNDFVSFFDGNFFESLRSRGITDKEINQFMAGLRVEMTAKYKDQNLMPGVKDMLDELSKSYSLVAITSNLTDLTKDYLASKGITVFSEVIGGDVEKSKIKKIESVKEKHPDSKIFYVGDTTGDVIEGRRAGATTVAASWGFHDKTRLEKSSPDYLVDSPEELASLFSKLPN
ncbi:MAG: HAD family hydrolase [Patescibacteria group bacterium]|nr:HAD family hydrolase [Patescibacteria group bacterium]